jgi:hypothetical protein
MVIRNVTMLGDDREVGITSDQGWVPNYPESADAALQLVEWMRKKEWWPSMSEGADGWKAAFIHHGDWLRIEATADTFQLAVCLAFLKANNIEPKTL